MRHRLAPKLATGLFRFSSLAGLNLRALYATRHVVKFLRDVTAYRRKAARNSTFNLSLGRLYPVLTDLDAQAGVASGQYFHQDLWAARKIYATRPAMHVDIGSRIDGFVSHLLCFVPVTVVDIRPLESDVEGLTFIKSDALQVTQFSTGSVESLSSLHALEHFGLGRYGDRIDPDAWFKGMRELARMLKPHGRLYVSVPIGVERLEFNAHRIFAPATVLSTFSDLTLVSFAAVDDAGRLRQSAAPEDFREAHYSCGLFEFTKP